MNSLTEKQVDSILQKTETECPECPPCNCNETEMQKTFKMPPEVDVKVIGIWVPEDKDIPGYPYTIAECWWEEREYGIAWFYVTTDNYEILSCIAPTYWMPFTLPAGVPTREWI